MPQIYKGENIAVIGICATSIDYKAVEAMNFAPSSYLITTVSFRILINIRTVIVKFNFYLNFIFKSNYGSKPQLSSKSPPFLMAFIWKTDF